LKEQVAFFEEIGTLMPSSETVLVVTKPEPMLMKPKQRFMLIYVMDRNYTKEQLSELQFHGNPRHGVAMLLPRILEEDGRAVALQSAFRDIHDWKRTPVRSDPRWTLWLSPKASGHQQP
jgi:hypothetical protein